MSMLDVFTLSHEETILDILKKDHDKVRKILLEVDKILGEYPTVSETQELALMKILYNELEPHAKAEEVTFYKDLKSNSTNNLNPYEGVEEHKLALQVLKTLLKNNLNANERSAKIQVLKEMLLHHIREEESQYFKQARELFSNEQLVKIGKEFIAAKKRFKEKI